MLHDELEYIKDLVFDTLKVKFDGVIEFGEKSGIYVKYENKKALICGGSKAEIARGIMLLMKNIMDGRNEFELEQKPYFESCGAMLDMSRNAVMKADSVKKYIKIMACLGMNKLMLYTEDTYEIKKYPWFGYRRGRYTIEELKEIDDFAYSLGIEVVPCIQTLGHMEQYLRWEDAADVKDTNNVLLCGSEKTYGLITEMIKTMRAAFRTKRIHIGMDEACSVGLGKYLSENGYQDRFEILTNHLSRVAEICSENGFKPMMWSDMFFRLGSKTGDYYDKESDLPVEIIAKIPDVELVYWDYYHKDFETYAALIQGHRKLGKSILFAGGIWLWGTLLPNIKMTFDTMIPAMQACIKNGIKDVVATIWGDNGAETNQFFSLGGLALFSEYCYLGESCSLDDIKSVIEFVTKFTYDDIMAFSAFNSEYEHGNIGKSIYYSDILYNIPGLKSYDMYMSDYKSALDYLNRKEIGGNWADFYYYAKEVLNIQVIKSDIMSKLRTAYQNNDREYLVGLYQKALPELKNDYIRTGKLHQKLWLGTNKVFGLEVINARYGIVVARLEYAIETIKAYCEGKLSEIEELTFEPMEEHWMNMLNFKDIVSTSNIL